MSRVTAKELHLQTKSILDLLEKGESLVVTRNGRPVARLEPVAQTGSADWDDVMGEVWSAQKEIKTSERLDNPVLQERARRRR
jgi:antitoxin (DNA-binding transcriptional repressor) of toxin-antitoxin stability system